MTTIISCSPVEKVAVTQLRGTMSTITVNTLFPDYTYMHLLMQFFHRRILLITECSRVNAYLNKGSEI